MEHRTVRLHSEDGRWLEMTVQGDRAMACVGGAEPFSFNLENLAYAAQGLGYQAWGAGGHFTVRHERGVVVVEFQGAGQRGVAVCRMSLEELRAAVDNIDVFAPPAFRASMI